MLRNKNEGGEEIKWRATSTYIDIDTGEIITKEECNLNYIIKNKKKKSYVYKTTGTIKITVECQRTKQFKLF